MSKARAAEKDHSSPPVECAALQRALRECYRRVRDELQREIACRHLNRKLAECLVSAFCPDEAEAVRSLCSSAGTSLKRSLCRNAQLSLSVCLDSYQNSKELLLHRNRRKAMGFLQCCCSFVQEEI